jgi:hypothetical protein
MTDHQVNEMCRRCDRLLASTRRMLARYAQERRKLRDSLGDEEAAPVKPGWEVVKHVIHRRRYTVRAKTYRALYWRRSGKKRGARS